MTDFFLWFMLGYGKQWGCFDLWTGRTCADMKRINTKSNHFFSKGKSSILSQQPFQILERIQLPCFFYIYVVREECIFWKRCLNWGVLLHDTLNCGMKDAKFCGSTQRWKRKFDTINHVCVLRYKMFSFP